MKNIGLTGGMGSGKSTVSAIFLALGIPCYIADDRSKELLLVNAKLQSELADVFPTIFVDGILDKKIFAQLIFKDKTKLELANSIIHPFVRNDYKEWMDKQEVLM